MELQVDVGALGLGRLMMGVVVSLGQYEMQASVMRSEIKQLQDRIKVLEAQLASSGGSSVTPDIPVH